MLEILRDDCSFPFSIYNNMQNVVLPCEGGTLNKLLCNEKYSNRISEV